MFILLDSKPNLNGIIARQLPFLIHNNILVSIFICFGLAHLSLFLFVSKRSRKLRGLSQETVGSIAWSDQPGNNPKFTPLTNSMVS